MFYFFKNKPNTYVILIICTLNIIYIVRDFMIDFVFILKFNGEIIQ